MKKIFSASLALLFSASLIACSQSRINTPLPVQQSVFSQSANNNWYEKLPEDLKKYYAPAQGKTGRDLFLALNKIISQNNRIGSYKEAKSYMYSRIDNNLQVKGGLLAAYSQIEIKGSGGNGNSYKERGDTNGDGYNNDFINCEHTWPQSLFNKREPMVADLHHLQSTLSIPNAARNHFVIGEGKGKTVTLVKSSGAKLTASPKGNMPEQEFENLIEEFKKVQHKWSDDAQKTKDLVNSKVDFTFEPPDANKGNTSRMLMYFFLRYYNSGITQADYWDSEKYWQSKIGTYISWSSQVDKVDSYEKERNQRIFQKQGNRNPFIDIPGLENLIGAETFRQIEASVR